MNKDSLIRRKDEVSSMAYKILQAYFISKDYSLDEVQGWSNHMSEEITKTLKGFSENYKYCVVCVILQKGDAGMNLSACSLWDSNEDCCFSLHYENNSMHCVLNFFCLLNKI